MSIHETVARNPFPVLRWDFGLFLFMVLPSHYPNI